MSMSAARQKLAEKISAMRGDHHFLEVLRGASWAMAAKIAGQVFGYGFILLISNTYGASVVGRFNLSFAIVNIVTMISLLGFPVSILRFAGEYAEDRALLVVLRKMLFLSGGLSLVFALAVWLVSDELAASLFHDPSLKDFLLVMVFGIPFTVTSGLLVEFLRGLRRIRSSELIRNSLQVFKLVLALILVFGLGFGELTPNVAYVGGAVLAWVIASTSVWNTVKKMRFFKCSEVTTGKILKISFPMLITASISLVVGMTDKFMLGMLKTSFDVGIYSVAHRLAVITSMVLAAINAIVAPKFSELYWSGRMDELRRVARFSARMIFFLSAPVLVLYFIFARQILALFGEDFVLGSTALVILSAGQLVNAMSGSVGYFMNMTDSQTASRNIVTVAAVLNVLLNYLLIPRFGVNGAAVATAISVGFWNIGSLIFVRLKTKLYLGYVPFIR